MVFKRAYLINAITMIEFTARAAVERTEAVEVSLAERGPRLYPDAEAALQRALQFPLFNIPDHSGRAMLERGLRRIGGSVAWARDPRLTVTSTLVPSPGEVTATAAAISCPHLLIEAEQGWKYCPDQWQEAIASYQTNPRFTHRVLPGCHHFHLETPGPVAETIAQWWQEVLPGIQPAKL